MFASTLTRYSFIGEKMIAYKHFLILVFRFLDFLSSFNTFFHTHRHLEVLLTFVNFSRLFRPLSAFHLFFTCFIFTGVNLVKNRKDIFVVCGSSLGPFLGTISWLLIRV
jgi:hypothetical protein